MYSACVFCPCIDALNLSTLIILLLLADTDSTILQLRRTAYDLLLVPAQDTRVLDKGTHSAGTVNVDIDLTFHEKNDT